MKREALNHTKMRRLARALEIPRYAAVGIVESLWCGVADRATKTRVEEVEIGIGWDGVEGILLQALIDCEILSIHRDGRIRLDEWVYLWVADGRVLRRTAAGGHIQNDVRALVLARDHYTCQGKGCRSTARLSIDHKKPISRGGTNEIENLVTLCGSCNSKKGNRNRP